MRDQRTQSLLQYELLIRCKDSELLQGSAGKGSNQANKLTKRN